MGPLELHKKIQDKRKRIAEKLDNHGKTGAAYAEAYGELNRFCQQIAIEVARFDPSFNLKAVDIPHDPRLDLLAMTYDEIIDREA